jgi:eukaryotic-like serine/threonine-protein kinase
MTALKKDPHERFASVKAFAVALEQASQESTSQAVVAPRAVRSSPPRDAGGSAEILPSIPAVPFVSAAGPSLAKSPAVISPGTLLLTYRGHTQPVESVAWSLDGRYLASASDDGTAQIWEALTGRCVHIYRGHTGKIAAIAWSPDGSLIASGGEDNDVQVWATPWHKKV